jgi:5-methylcytosine-specific restriction endonuclease McrA
MTRNIKRACIDCGQLCEGSRCPEHQRAAKRRTRTTYSPKERERMRRAVNDHIAKHGPICIGFKRAAHRSYNLTADHVAPVSEVGEGGVLRVLCKECNSRRGGELGAERRRDRDPASGSLIL